MKIVIIYIYRGKEWKINKHERWKNIAEDINKQYLFISIIIKYIHISCTFSTYFLYIFLFYFYFYFILWNVYNNIHRLFLKETNDVYFFEWQFKWFICTTIMQTNYFIQRISFRKRNIPYITHDKPYKIAE